jgi:hypothetical protein
VRPVPLVRLVPRAKPGLLVKPVQLVLPVQLVRRDQEGFRVNKVILVLPERPDEVLRARLDHKAVLVRPVQRVKGFQ